MLSILPAYGRAVPAYGRLLSFSLYLFCKAAGKSCSARLLGKAAGLGCMQWCNMLKKW
jgi:hypothetical protein